MAILISIPVFVSLTLIQSGIFSRLPLLNGTVDLVLLVIIAWSLQERVKTAIEWSIIGGLIAGLATALPFGIILGSYFLATGISLYLKRRIWKIPILGMLSATFIGTILVFIASYFAVSLTGTFLPITQTLNMVLLPSLLLNIITAIPVYILTTDLASWIYPEEL
jgi:cell shape-determining protein MreD